MVLIKLSALNLVFKEIFHWVSFNIIRRSVDFVGALGRVASPLCPSPNDDIGECLHLAILCFYCFNLDYYFSIALKIPS